MENNVSADPYGDSHNIMGAIHLKSCFAVSETISTVWEIIT